MKLVNFDLAQAYETVTLLGLGVEWDLHNCATFTGFRLDPTTNTLLMEWASMVRPEWGCRPENVWGDLKNSARSCGLLFRNVYYLVLQHGDSPRPSDGSGETCLTGLSKTEPGQGELGFKFDWKPSDEFNLFFRFESGREVEIGAESVELVRDP